MQCKTLDPANQFQIECPVFHATTKIAACFELRDRVWRGEPQPVRHGCQVAMHAGKCPINDIVKRMVKNPSLDPYHSATPTVGRLDAVDLEKISRVIVPASRMDMCSPAERSLLLKGNENAKNGVIERPKRKPIGAAKKMEAMPPAPVATEPAPTDASSLIEAARTGDMTAAINEEVKATEEKRGEV